MNAHRVNVYVGVNAVAAGKRARTRDSMASIRHVFLEADHDGDGVLARARVHARSDLPPPSYVLHSSPGRVHVFWRVGGFDGTYVERLQKQLARELQTDSAAHPGDAEHTTAGLFNHKRAQPHLVTIEYRNVDVRYGPEDFPRVKEAPAWQQTVRPRGWQLDLPAIDRAKRYLASVPPAIAGQHGDVHAFRICCRLVRGFALNDDQALHVLADWNARCEPPWSLEGSSDRFKAISVGARHLQLGDLLPQH